MWNESPCLAIGHVTDQITAQVTSASEAVPRGSGFTCASLDAATRARVQDQVQAEFIAIRGQISDDVGSRIDIGGRLITLQGLLGRFEFQPLVKRECGWSKGCTTNYMNVARVFPDLDTQCRLHIHWYALVILARKDVHPAARAQALNLARDGKFVNKKLAEALVSRAREDAECGHGPLLDQTGRAWERFNRLLAELRAARPELTDEQDDALEDLMAVARQTLDSPPAPEFTMPVAEFVRIRTSTDNISDTPPVAEFVRIRTPDENVLDAQPAPEFVRIQTSTDGLPDGSPVAEFARMLAACVHRGRNPPAWTSRRIWPNAPTIRS